MSTTPEHPAHVPEPAIPRPEDLPPEAHTPEAGELNPEALTVAFIDQSDDVRDFARDAADARLTAELNDGEPGRFRRMVRGIWKGNIARDYYRQKYIREAEGSIVEDGTLYANREDVDEAARTRARVATVNRFVGDYESAIHTDAGEKRKDVSAAETAGEDGASELITRTKSLIRSYAEGTINDEELREQRTRMLDELRTSGGRQQLFGEGVMVADNMLEIAQNVRTALDHGESIDRVLENIRIVSGESRSGARTEAQYNKVDKIIDRINGSRIGSLLNESTVATAVTVAASMARFGSTKLASAATMTVAPGIGSGVVAGLRENKRIKDERRQHAREMATGQDYDRGNARRRDAMQETVYETVTAESLIEDLAVRTDRERIIGGDETVLRDALDSILDARTRISLSDRRDIDLISYSSVAEVENERFVLDIALAEAKVALKEALDAADEGTRHNLGIDDDQTLDENLANLSESQQDLLEQDITQKDAAFKALQRREVAKTTAKAALIGMGLGMVAQEVKAMIDPSTQGLVEQIWHAKNTPIDGRNHETLLHGFFGTSHNGHETVHHAFSGKMHERVLGHGTKMNLSEEYHMTGSNGNYQLIDASGKHIGALKYDSHGALTPDSIQRLRHLGLTVHDKSTTTTELITTHHTGNVNEWLAHNQGGTTHVQRNLWYDNNTPAPKFDKNELGLQWGGANSAGLDEHGNYIFNTHAMTYGGSYHAAEQAHWQELAAQGKLKMAFSATGDSQHQVFMVNIDANGNAIIPKGSPVAQMFTTENGHAVFNGKYAEVVQSLGTDQSKTEHIRMLATYVGKDNLGAKPFDITDIVPKTTTHHAYDIIGKNYDTTRELGRFIEMAPVIPIYSRKSLENILANTDETPRPYYYGREAATPEEIAERRRRFSPRLQENPNVELDDREEIEWYFHQQTPEHRERVRRNANAVGEPMKDSTRIVVTIPVAGHQESDNIYRTLSAYLDQTLPTDQFEIMLYVNHPVTDKSGKKLNADDTLREIERFKQDHPEMPVRVAYEALPRSKAKIGYIRKVLVDTVLQRQMDRATDEPLALISNDADAIAINPKYLEVMLRKLDEDKTLDAVVGQVDWDNKAYVNYPAVHIGTRLFQFFDISLRNKEGHITPTSGANSAFRAATYAAINGYDDSVDEAGEDVRLGRDMEFARNGTDRQAVGFGGVVGSRIETSARRSIHTLLAHYDAPYNQWNYEFGADDDDIRRINVTDLKPEDFADPEVRARVTADVEHMINKTLEDMYMGPEGTAGSESRRSVGANGPIDEQRAKYLSRAFAAMGIKFEWDGSYRKIKITDASSMINGLHNYAIRAIRKDMIEQGVPTSGGMMMVNGKMRRANGQFMSKKEREAIEANLPRLFGGTALAGA